MELCIIYIIHLPNKTLQDSLSNQLVNHRSHIQKCKLDNFQSTHYNNFLVSKDTLNISYRNCKSLNNHHYKGNILLLQVDTLYNLLGMLRKCILLDNVMAHMTNIQFNLNKYYKERHTIGNQACNIHLHKKYNLLILLKNYMNLGIQQDMVNIMYQVNSNLQCSQYKLHHTYILNKELNKANNHSKRYDKIQADRFSKLNHQYKLYNLQDTGYTEFDSHNILRCNFRRLQLLCN